MYDTQPVLWSLFGILVNKFKHFSPLLIPLFNTIINLCHIYCRNHNSKNIIKMIKAIIIKFKSD